MMGLRLQKVDWPKISGRNKGCFAVEYDPQFPGCFYVRHKGTPYYLPATKYDIEHLVENALAALGQHHGPLLVASKEDQTILAYNQARLFEVLNEKVDTEWLKWLLWNMLSKTAVNERVSGICDIQPGNL